MINKSKIQYYNNEGFTTVTDWGSLSNEYIPVTDHTYLSDRDEVSMRCVSNYDCLATYCCSEGIC